MVCVSQYFVAVNFKKKNICSLPKSSGLLTLGIIVFLKFFIFFDRKLSIFTHGNNKRMLTFFAINENTFN